MIYQQTIPDLHKYYYVTLSKAGTNAIHVFYKLVSTKGNIVASTYRFVDIHEIEFVFSNLLQMDSFLDYMIKLNNINQTRSVLDGHPIPIEYEKLSNGDCPLG
jgi:hypothetical protein